MVKNTAFADQRIINTNATYIDIISVLTLTCRFYMRYANASERDNLQCCKIACFWQRINFSLTKVMTFTTLDSFVVLGDRKNSHFGQMRVRR